MRARRPGRRPPAVSPGVSLLGQALGGECPPSARQSPGPTWSSSVPPRGLPGPRKKARPLPPGGSMQPQIQHLHGGQCQARPRVSPSLGSNLSPGGGHAFLAGLGVAGASIPSGWHLGTLSEGRSWRIWPRGSERGAREGWQSGPPRGTRDSSHGSEQSNFSPSRRCCRCRVTQECRPEPAGPLGTEPGPCKT